MALPDTRHSLLLRLHDRADAAAWTEFCAIYEPAILATAQRFGMQQADAREVSQEVFLLISRKIESFDVGRDGTFRGWLARLAKHTTIDSLRRSQIRGTGLSDVQRMLGEVAEGTGDEQSVLSLETKRQLFAWAAGRVKHTVAEDAWQSFWLTAVDQVSAQDVAKQLQISVGSVYVARCRTLAKIRRLIQTYQEELA